MKAAQDAPRCLSCRRALVPHCAPRRFEPAIACGWWKCTNGRCEAAIYDYRHNRRSLRSGATEVLPA